MDDLFKLPTINFKLVLKIMGEQNDNNIIQYFEIIERLIGHLAWPIVVLIIFLYFKSDLIKIIRRIKSAEIKDFKFELEEKLEDVKKEAINNSVTMFYPIDAINRQFNPTDDKTKETQILDAWKKIEHRLFELDERNNAKNVNDTLNYLVKTKKIQKYLAKMILDLRELRNIVVHNQNPYISEEDFQNWMSISKSVIDRLN